MARRTIATKDNTITSQGTEPLSREVARPIFGENVLAIDYNFAEKDYLDDDIDFSRASGATQTGSDGYIKYAPNNVLTSSEDIVNDWTQRGSVSVTAGQSDPDGGTTAYLFDGVIGAGLGDVYQNVLGLPANAPYVVSFYIKKVTSTGTLYINSPQTAGAGQWNVDLSKIGTGWERITESHAAVTVVNSHKVHTNGGGGIHIYSGGDLDFYFWHPQIEMSFSSSDAANDYISTGSGSAVHKERLDWTKDGDKKGLLIEEARTNYVPYSQDFSQSDWIKTNSTIAPSGETDPSGGTGAYKLTLNADDSSARIHDSFSSTAGEHTCSFYVKKGTASDIRVGFNDEGTAGRTLDFNLETGQIIQTSGANNTFVQDCGNGWYRVGVSGNIAASGNDTFFLRGFTTNSNTSSGDYLYIFGAQLEQGSFPSSLIPNYGTSSGVTRSADIAEVTGTNFSRFYKDTEGTFVVDAQVPKGYDYTNYYGSLFQASDNSSSDRIELYLNNNEVPVGNVRTNSEGQITSGGTSTFINSGEIFSSTVGYKENNFRAFTDNSNSTLNTSVTLPTNLIELTIGHKYGNTKQLNGWIRRLRYFNKRKSDSQLQNLVSQDKLLQRFKGAKAAHSLRALTDFDKNPVTRIRREYDSYEADYTAAQVANGDLEKDFRSADQTTLPLDVSVEADEMVTGGDFTELVTNGGFDADSDWTKQSGWTIGSGVASVDSSVAGATMLTSTGMTLEVGKKYTVTYTINSVSGSGIRSTLGGVVEGSYRTAAGTFSHTVTATTTDGLIFTAASNDTTAAIDNVSVVEGGWTLNAHMSISEGTLNFLDTAFGSAYQSASLRKGKTYTVSFDVISGTTPSIWIGNSQGTYSYDGRAYATRNIGHHTETFTLTSDQTSLAFFFHVDGTTCSIDNVSLKEVKPIATGFSTRKINSDYTGYGPMRIRNNDDQVEAELGWDSNNEISLDSPVKATSMNLLGHSEDFTEIALNGSATVEGGQSDPFGGNNAYKVNASSVNYSGIAPSVNGLLTAGDYYTISAYMKAGTSTLSRLGVYDDNTNPFWISVDVAWSASGVPSTSASVGASNINYEAIGTDGWYRVSFTGQALATDGNQYFMIHVDRNATSKNVLIYGIQLEETVYEDTGTEKITNGDFSDGTTDWSTGNSGTLTVDNGALVVTGDGGSYAAAKRLITTTVGAKYKLTGQGAVKTGSYALRVELRQGSGSWQNLFETTNTTMTSFDVEVVSVDSSWDLRFTVFNSTVTSSESITIDDISVLEYDPELQSYTQTPVVSDAHNSTSATNLREFAGKENLLPYSNEFTNSAWSNYDKMTANRAISPTGENNASEITTQAAIYDSVGSVGGNITVSIHAKKNTASHFVLSGGYPTSQRVIFDLETGVACQVIGGATHTSESLGNGWFRFSVTVPSNSSADYIQFSARSSCAFSNNRVAGAYVYGAQINTGSTVKPYQETTGTAKTADVHCVQWYDQGGGEDFTQSTTGEQPRIVMGSELVTSNGKASVYFDGGDTLQNNTLAGQNRLDGYYIQDTSDIDYLYPSDTVSSRFGIVAENGSSSGINSNFGTPSYYVNGALQSFSDRDDVHDALTGSTKLLSQHNGSTSNWTNLEVGHYLGANNSNYNFTGKISEMVFFPNMDSSPKRYPIEQNMMNAFNVPYHRVDFENFTTSEMADNSVMGPSGSSTLGTATLSAETANPISGTQSMKIVTTSGNNNSYPRIYLAAKGRLAVEPKIGEKYRLTFDTKLISGNITIRNISFRDGSDVPPAFLKFSDDELVLSGTQTHTYETTITDLTSITKSVYWSIKGTTSAGTFLLDNIKIEKIGEAGYVTTLYDQTGNNCHATQSTAAEQPQIVDGGDLIKSGNHPAWYYRDKSSGNDDVLSIPSLAGLSRLDAFFVHEVGSDTTFMYPTGSATGGHWGMLAQSSSSTNWQNYKSDDSSLVFVNGTQGSPTSRLEYLNLVNGRKLVHHQNGETTSWTHFNMSDYNLLGTSSNNLEDFKFSEWIWYDSDQSSNRTGIESNINDHYNIY